jgi:hypothetical protein
MTENTGGSEAPRSPVEVLPKDVERNRRLPCPVCGFPIGAVRGSKAAICTNCGFKDGCC